MKSISWPELSEFDDGLVSSIFAAVPDPGASSHQQQQQPHWPEPAHRPRIASPASHNPSYSWPQQPHNQQYMELTQAWKSTATTRHSRVPPTHPADISGTIAALDTAYRAEFASWVTDPANTPHVAHWLGSIVSELLGQQRTSNRVDMHPAVAATDEAVAEQAARVILHTVASRPQPQVPGAMADAWPRIAELALGASMGGQMVGVLAGIVRVIAAAATVSAAAAAAFSLTSSLTVVAFGSPVTSSQSGMVVVPPCGCGPACHQQQQQHQSQILRPVGPAELSSASQTQQLHQLQQQPPLPPALVALVTALVTQAPTPAARHAAVDAVTGGWPFARVHALVCAVEARLGPGALGIEWKRRRLRAWADRVRSRRGWEAVTAAASSVPTDEVPSGPSKRPRPTGAAAGLAAGSDDNGQQPAAKRLRRDVAPASSSSSSSTVVVLASGPGDELAVPPVVVASHHLVGC
ncbi:hypothetical protein BC828DRAFT_384968 [Blastocladiella britannica]|nr:hypothetical protein BC828DRAFT_384968 [Blastocladiella britannica]